MNLYLLVVRLNSHRNGRFCVVASNEDEAIAKLRTAHPFIAARKILLLIVSESGVIPV